MCDPAGDGCACCREELVSFVAWSQTDGRHTITLAEHGIELAKLEANDPLALFVPVGNPDNYSMDCY